MPKSNRRKRNPRKAIRQRTEQAMGTTGADTTEKTPEDLQRLIDELQVRHLELASQNEELRNAERELSVARDRYSNLYEFAPVGYLTLGSDGTIFESNLTSSTILGVDRRLLLRANIAQFIARESRDRWRLYLQSAFSSGTRQTCRIEMYKPDGTPMAIRAESIAFGVPGEFQFIRIYSCFWLLTFGHAVFDYPDGPSDHHTFEGRSAGRSARRRG